MWKPSNEFVVQVPEKEKHLYEADDPRCIYYDQRWLYRKGRHKRGEFPVVVVRKQLIEVQGDVVQFFHFCSHLLEEFT
jgi:hypothetical protein